MQFSVFLTAVNAGAVSGVVILKRERLFNGDAANRSPTAETGRMRAGWEDEKRIGVLPLYNSNP